jgi:hypothetical protein
VGAGAAALPLLGHQSATQAGSAFPKRFVVFFTANGTIPDEWRPDGGETDFGLRRILEPLEPHRNDLLILDGIDMVSARNGPGDGHQQGMGHMLTANELLPGDVMGGCDSCAPVSWAASISIDQRIANQISDGTRFRSLELGVKTPNNANVWTRMCYTGASEPLPPERNPYAAFDRVFGDLDPTGFGDPRREFMRRQVVDHVYEDYQSVRGQLGRDDRSRIERHIEGIDSIARRLDDPTALGASCNAPIHETGLDPNSDDHFPMIGQLQMDNLVMSMACDLTRVGSIQWGASVSQQVLPWLGFNDRHHDLSHEGDGNADAKEKLIQINRWYAEQFAYLIQKMKEIPEGDGTMLDNTCIVWTNELGKGNSHTRNDMPCVIAGSAGGYFRTGRCLRFAEESHSNLWVSMAQAYGVETDTFGNPEYCRGTISSLT